MFYDATCDCGICNNVYVPTLLRRSIKDENDYVIIIHAYHYPLWARNEVERQLRFIMEKVEKLKGICMEASRFCKKIKKAMGGRQGRLALSELKALFYKIVKWIRDNAAALNLKEMPLIRLWDEICRRINFVNRIFNEKEVAGLSLASG